MTKTNLVICGSIALDRIMNFSGHYRDLIEPAKLHVLSVSVLLDSLEEASGGTGANIAYNLATLGERPILLGSVGQDAAAYLQHLADEGIDTSHVHTSKLKTASFNVLTDSDNNQVGGFYPGAMADADSLSFAPWKGQDAIFCLSAHDPVAMHRQVKECADHSLRLFYDPGQQVSNISADDLRSGVTAAEVVIVNDYELGVLAKKTGLTPAELQAQVPILITTHGEKGSEISGNKIESAVQIQAAKPSQIIDPTGAGDAYRAGFLYGYLRKWDVRQCGQLGSVLASFVLEQPGTQVKLTLDSISERYQQTYKEEINL